jgi:predicted DNA-binding transcriptional regulator YafY
MRASRLLSILLLLQSRGRLTAGALAAELEVSVRTIYRDVESLHEAGIPLYGDAGHAGGYQLLDGYRTRLTGLSSAEAEALFLAGLPGPAAALGLGTVLAAAQLKVRAALPAELREGAGRIQERFHLDAPGWYVAGDETPHLIAVADAVWNERRIQVCYRRWAVPTDVTRTLNPYGLVIKAGRWYVVAASGTSTRTFRVDQILDLEPLDERFSRPADFDLVGYWQGYVAEFRDRLQQGVAVVRLSPHGLSRVPDVLGSAVISAVEQTAGAPDAAGWVTATIPIESLTSAQSQLLALGADIEVMTPADLRDRIAATAAALASLYG